MTDSIVLQLQMLASDPNSDIEELLNKALLVASKLKIKEFKKWCEAELAGYGKDNVPDYRKFNGQLKVFNPYHGLQPFIIPDEFDSIVTHVDMYDSIGQIQNLLKQNNSHFIKTLSNKQKIALMRLQDDYVQLEPRVIIYPSQLLAIITKVRNSILRWSIELEEEGILGKGFRFTEKEKEVAMSVHNYHIQNMQGVVGHVNESTVNQNNQMNVYAKDFDSLAQVLTDNKITFSDIQKLKDAIDADDLPNESKKFGKNVSEWIGKMVGKAATGSWEISVATAGTLLAEAIGKFYGF